MKTSKSIALVLGATALAVLVPSETVRADPAGDKLLTSVEEALNRAKTQYFVYDISTQQPGKPETKQALELRMKGEKSLFEYTAPADMKGIKVLVLSPTQMYVYLPAFGKVRRIATTATDQAFLGMTFSLEDFQTRWSGEYTATVLSESATQARIAATPKAGQQPLYGKIEFTIAKDRMVPIEIKYFNTGGTLVKTETRTGYTCQGNICTPAEQKMIDQTKGGMWTKLARKAWKVNEAMSDDLFSKRSLEK